MARTNTPLDESSFGLSDFGIEDIVETPKVDPLGAEAVKLSKEKRYPQIEAYWKAKVEFYQKYLPGGGLDVASLPAEELKANYLAAEKIIMEFRDFMGVIEHNVEAIKRAKR